MVSGNIQLGTPTQTLPCTPEASQQFPATAPRPWALKVRTEMLVGNIKDDLVVKNAVVAKIIEGS